jgi:DNA-binding beta-propeller fold protein YncE
VRIRSLRPRSAIASALKLAPALVLSAILIGAAACGGHGIFGDPTPTPAGGGGGGGGGGGSGSATPTPSGFAYVTNFNDGLVSEFSRNTSTGALTLKGTVKGGSANGPMGIALDPSDSFVFVANSADDQIRQYTINSKGTLNANGKVSVAAGSAPHQIAIAPSGNFLWVTAPGAGSVISFKITNTGTLTKSSPLAGFVNPFGIVVNSTSSIVYVTDPGAAGGTITPCTVNADGSLTAGTSVTSPTGTHPSLLAIDPGGTNLWVMDSVANGATQFPIHADGSLGVGAFTSLPQIDNPIGVVLPSLAGGTFLFEANQAGGVATKGSVAAFLVSGTVLTFENAATGLNSPTQVVVDSKNAFAYATDQGDGTVIQLTTCNTGVCSPVLVSTENPVNAASGPFGIALTH